MNNKEKGDLGEKIALKYLLLKGAILIEKNYRTKLGEIDIIVKIKNELVFVEVKSRNSIRFGYPSEAVNFKKKQKIINIAKYYILKNNLYSIPVRFDVIEIYLNQKKINHIINAF